jgi:hypothetical protein
MYAHWLGGKDSFAADRAAADAVLERFPEVAEVARANRAFLARAVRHVARQPVTQFVDFGAGLPASPNVHEIAGQLPGHQRGHLDRHRSGTAAAVAGRLQRHGAGHRPDAEEITAWFDGFCLARPGLVDVWAWRPDSIQRPAQSRARILAGVGWPI